MPKTPYLLVLALTACSDSYTHEPGPAYGELGVGVFLYQCPTSGDPFCDGGTGVGDEFPRAFALRALAERSAAAPSVLSCRRRRLEPCCPSSRRHSPPAVPVGVQLPHESRVR